MGSGARVGRGVAAALGAALAAALALGAGSGCGEGGPQAPAPRTRRPGDEVATFDQVMIGYAVPGRTPFSRTKADARARARRTIERARAGEPFEALIREVTDDRDERGEPFNRGSYTIARRATPALPAVKEAVFLLAPGELRAEPLDTGLAYLVLRRTR